VLTIILNQSKKVVTEEKKYTYLNQDNSNTTPNFQTASVCS